MCRHLRVALIVGALAAPGVGATRRTPSPHRPARAAERQAPPARASGGGGGDRAVARAAPAPRAEAPRARACARTSGATASSGDQNRRGGVRVATSRVSARRLRRIDSGSRRW